MLLNLHKDNRIVVSEKKKIRLSKYPCDYKDGIKDKQTGLAVIDEFKKQMSELQDMLYAQDRYSLLIIFQAMDAAGKDGTVRHVLSGINPQGCRVANFKKPTVHELDHDYLWRCYRELPERGQIGIFNRSYYEEVLVTKVHPEYVLGQRIPGIDKLKNIDERFWKKRYETINAFEKHLVQNGTVILKFFLHVSKDEQKKRFLERIEDPGKNWKFSYQDLQERKFWNKYISAYEDTIGNTSTKWAPWYIIPADDNWFRHLAVSEIILQAMKKMKLSYPKPSSEEMALLVKGKRELQAEK